MLSLLTKSELAGGVEIHKDCLSSIPTALSRQRAQRLGKPDQEPNKDNEGGASLCILCNPEKLRGQPTLELKAGKHVANFPNAASYMPYAQKVMYLWDHDRSKRMDRLHIFQLKDVRRAELYFLTKAAIEYGQVFARGPIRSYDLPRMIFGFNLGKDAGQTIPHIHAQYGWDVVVGGETVTEERLKLYYQELEQEQLIIYQDEGVKVVAPWTPKGQYHIDLHFPNKFEVHRLEEKDIKIFAHLGYAILQHYVNNLTIQNLNITFLNSPLQKEIIPVVVRFVPRVNKPALYESLGIDVVDTPPGDIAAEFRRSIRWDDEMRNADDYNPEEEIKEILK